MSNLFPTKDNGLSPTGKKIWKFLRERAIQEKYAKSQPKPVKWMAPRTNYPDH